MRSDESGRRSWQRAVILAGLVYLVAGVGFGALAGRAASGEMRVTWRLLAWLISAAAFAAQIGYEQFRLRSSPVNTALHASLATGLGALGLAVAANLHAHSSGSSHPRSFAFLTLAAWPAITAVPAFVVALGAAALFALRRRGG
jgi:hypothetical protein